ncbi:MAG: transcriptional repressor [Elusimicrobia bacterium]|nr:transcriptional repressor [Elusimicrobiota bacterium]
MKELDILNRYLIENGLNKTVQREIILAEFMSAGKHLTAQELSETVRSRHPSLGHVTVFRALKLFVDAGIARALELGDGTTRYEHCYACSHHDHLICGVCGKTVEFCSHEIERLQEELAKKHGFALTGHRMDLFGRCAECAAKPPDDPERRRPLKKNREA